MPERESQDGREARALHTVFKCLFAPKQYPIALPAAPRSMHASYAAGLATAILPKMRCKGRTQEQDESWRLPFGVLWMIMLPAGCKVLESTAH